MESTSNSAVAADSSAPTEMTPAQRLMALHAEAQAHQPTVEEVVDEDDLAHPPPTLSTPSQNAVDSAAPSTMSAKAAGKQRAQDTTSNNNDGSKSTAKAPLDMQSEEAFPSLGAPKAKNPTTSAWSSKPASVGKSNGVNGASFATNASSGASTPVSAGLATRNVQQPRNVAQPMAIPGRHTQDMIIQTSQLKSKADLKKPIPELLRDLNKRSKAKVEMKSGPGVVIFTGQGPSSELVVQALKDVAAEVSAKVGHRRQYLQRKLTSIANRQNAYSGVLETSDHW